MSYERNRLERLESYAELYAQRKTLRAELEKLNATLAEVRAQRDEWERTATYRLRRIEGRDEFADMGPMEYPHETVTRICNWLAELDSSGVQMADAIEAHFVPERTA